MCEQIKKKHEMDSINNSNVLDHNGHTFFITALIFYELTRHIYSMDTSLLASDFFP